MADHHTKMRLPISGWQLHMKAWCFKNYNMQWLLIFINVLYISYQPLGAANAAINIDQDHRKHSEETSGDYCCSGFKLILKNSSKDATCFHVDVAGNVWRAHFTSWYEQLEFCLINCIKKKERRMTMAPAWKLQPKQILWSNFIIQKINMQCRKF